MLSRFEQFSFVISGIYRYIQKLEKDEMIQYGYKGAFAQYLVAIQRYPEGVTSAQLCEICEKDKAAISRIVAEMEEKGLIIRQSNNQRRYKALIRLTEEGQKAADFVTARARAAVTAVGAELSDADRQVLYSALDQIVLKLQTLIKEGIPTHEIAKEKGDPSL